MSPEQAVVLGAGQLVPVHHGTSHNPPWYAGTPDVVPRLRASAENRVELTVVQTTDELVQA
ncbi:hypothetical protein SAMN04488107_2212 [Geodermatophilus saharensis]|uniref:Uncharacterized protein n=1 Tax=Geodermatophilus saharensis TaxID=1137994 RepID=A0A239DKG7_9ACTN|nr:hypothetical protein [Geodermatophilus saharensis]SNS32541.1 hypothetical protein SAMN04488107_2212 [Geodermatophilus saharensis]